ncbi:MAG: pantetheine-phosphate adenylyltransferase [Alphaproteobacteria bacterium]|nr:pantetheine-phosphate adenylyltransferase [Alphaproteobacteria bacterium]
MSANKRIGIYAGTFDPITNGHVDIILRAAHMVDHLIVAVAKHTDKSPLFSLEDRVDMVEKALDSMDTEKLSTRLEVTSFDSLLVNYALSQNASMLIRGLRAVSDFEYEFKMAAMNGRLAPSLETVFLMATDKSQFISSRFIKEISKLGGDISPFVSPYVHNKLIEQHRKVQNA